MITLEQLPLKSLKFKFINASGPGGQHVNKASTAVELAADLDQLNLPYGLMTRLKLKYHSRINKQGKLIIQVDKFKSQHQNRKQATTLLLNMLNNAAKVPKRRVATSPTKSSKRKRLDKKKQRSLTKSRRKTPFLENL